MATRAKLPPASPHREESNTPWRASRTRRGVSSASSPPGVRHTSEGMTVLDELPGGLRLPPRLNATSFIDYTVTRIRETVGDARVLCALSGGVDSAVAALLVHRAIGDRLVCVFVDNGLCGRTRPPRSASVRRQLKLKVVFVDATRRFLSERAASRSRAEAEDLGREFITSPEIGEADEGGTPSRPGHAIPGRH